MRAQNRKLYHRGCDIPAPTEIDGFKTRAALGAHTINKHAHTRPKMLMAFVVKTLSRAQSRARAA